MKDSISVLEHFMPRFFLNTTEILKSILNAKNPNTFDRITNRNPLSKAVTERTRQILMENPVFQLEYDFYYFVKRRIYKKMYPEIKLNSSEVVLIPFRLVL